MRSGQQLKSLCCALLLVCSAGALADSAAIMDHLKSLEGDWMLVDENGEVTTQVASRFEISAAGSVVRELMFPGDSHEMMNVFHADGERVLMTHYCAAGSQPRLEVVPTDDGEGLLLKFESITNLPSPESHFMHHAEYAWAGDSRLTTTWYGSEKGKILEETTRIEAVRAEE